MWLIDIFKVNDFKSQIQSLKRENAALSGKLSSLEGENYFSIQGKVGELNTCYDQRLQESQTLSVQIRERFEKVKELDKQIIEKQRLLTKTKEMYQGIEAAVQAYRNHTPDYTVSAPDEKFLEECEKITPSTRAALFSMDDKLLYEAYLEKEKIITDIFRHYTSEFSSSSDKAIYELVVLYLRAEIQNILYGAKNGSSEASIDSVKGLCKRCLRIACSSKLDAEERFVTFIGEMEYQLSDLVQIELQYCSRKPSEE